MSVAALRVIAELFSSFIVLCPSYNLILIFTPVKPSLSDFSLNDDVNLCERMKLTNIFALLALFTYRATVLLYHDS